MNGGRSAVRRGDPTPSHSVDRVVSSPGRPLDPVTRAWAEPRFGRDFSRVRVHTDDTAAGSAAELGARAYTAGPHIAFSAGNYRPDSEAGTRLLAHELTHVGQQTGDIAHTDALEAEAHARSRSPGHAPTSMRSASPLQAAGVQRFGEEEHRSLGNTATNSATYDIGIAAAPFSLTHGDLVMLGGDWFLSADLFDFATRPGKNGAGLGTQDEIITALQKNSKQKDPRNDDRRFLSGGIWFGFTPSEPVKKAVEERFNRLAAANDPHFAAPKGRDASGKPLPARLGSAGSTYRTLHEDALELAYDAGVAKTPVDRALAREAAAQHYLTDAFSAGHVRTPVQSMREYWAAKYPLFFYNLLHKIALDTAIRMNEIDTNLTTIVGSVQDMYENIIGRVNQMKASLPEVGLGDLLALVFHDYDNVTGMEVEGGGRVFGDGNLGNPSKDNVTRPRAQLAIQLGIRDVNEAHALGAAGGAALTKSALIAEVLKKTQAPGAEFLAETAMPKPAASTPRQNWQAPDFVTLWSTPVTTAPGAPTIGSLIVQGVQPHKTIRDQLDALGGRFDVVGTRWSGNVQPRRAYFEGFVARIVRDPKGGILSIINWAPNYGLQDSDQDDISLATGRELDQPATPGGRSRLVGMTPQARVSYVRELIGDNVDADEEELVLRIFSTAPPNHRPWMYHSIEGHPWTGKLINGGLFDPDDELWNALTKPRIRRLENLINNKVAAP